MGGAIGSDPPVIVNSKKAAAFESLEGLFSGLTWWSGWQMGETHFLGQSSAQKPQNWPKSMFCDPLVVESWLTPQNDYKTWFTMGLFRYIYIWS